MHQTLSGHFSLWLSRETPPCHEAPSAARRPQTLTSAGPRPEGLLLLRVLRPRIPRCKDLTLAVIHHEISFAMLSDELITLMKPSSPLRRGRLRNHTQELGISRKSARKKKKRKETGGSSASPVRLRDLEVKPANPSEWRAAVTAKLPHLTHRTRQRTGSGHEGHQRFMAMTWQSYIGSHHVGGNTAGLAGQVKYSIVGFRQSFDELAG